MEDNKIKSVIESLLFMNGDPIKISKLVKMIGAESAQVEKAIVEMQANYLQENSGLMLVRKEDEVQLATKKDNASFVEELVKSELQGPLSTAALEVLSIIAYRGPISKPEIESIRGVNCSYTLRNLLMRGLIERRNNPEDARGYVYVVSFELLKKIGVESVEKLPEYDKLSVDERINSIINKAQE